MNSSSVLPWQIVLDPSKVTVGNALTVTVTDPVCRLEQAVELASLTLIRLYTNSPGVVVDAAMVAAFPEEVIV